MTQRLTAPPKRRASWRRPATISLAACTVLCLLIPRPSYGDPGGSGVPDPGAPPVASVPIQPGGGTSSGLPTVSAPVAGPLAAQVQALSDQVEAIGEQLKSATIQAQQAQAATDSTYLSWQQAENTAHYLRDRANSAAGQAYKQADSLGPFGAYANQLHQLGMLAPGLSTGVPDGGPNAAQAADHAEQEARTALAAYQAAVANEANLDQRRAGLQQQYDQKSAALKTLRSQNTAQLAAEQAQQDRLDLNLALQYNIGSSVHGMHAGPKAQAAVHYALSKVNHAVYIFGAEGPNAFDCSGLTWASYHSVGINIPRTAHEQAAPGALTSVTSLGDLLPGDLIFYTPNGSFDWRQVSHVAMYIGDNQMVEAANQVDDLRVAPVRISHIFGLARVVPAVKDSPNPTPAPPAGQPSPSPTAHSPQPTLTPASPKPLPSIRTTPPSPTPGPTPTSAAPPDTGSSTGSGSSTGTGSTEATDSAAPAAPASASAPAG